MANKKKYPFYLVVKVEIEVDCSQTNQDPDDHIAEIADVVGSELNYEITFDDKVESGNGEENAIEVPVKITNTEVMGIYDTNPA